MSKRNITIQKASDLLRKYVEAEGFAGYDPYDALNAKIPFQRMGKWPAVLVTQALKRLPLNIRHLLGIKKGINPKAMGLLLHAYSMMYQRTPSPEIREKMEDLFRWLEENVTPGYSGAAWGYNFAWANPGKTVPAFTPSAVVTGFICRGIHDYHSATKNPDAKNLITSAAEFIDQDLEKTEFPEGICISYTPVQRDCCYNASLLAVEVLALADRVSEQEAFKDTVRKAVDFVVSRQKGDGHWNYSQDLKTGAEREQVDFHQGYIVESIHRIATITGTRDERWAESVARGARFYREQQFTSQGRSLWRWPRRWPVDIHHQAQGIITFAGLKNLGPEYPECARHIAEWTIRHMRSPRGYFYYRKYRVGANRIPFMRWAQAWILLALAVLAEAGL